ncbi:MAG: EF-P lysine aminoacylase EpmA [Nitrospirota bacterium]|jgi:lysyl-tRNA synthetase class 2
MDSPEALHDRRPFLVARAAVLREIRAFFDGRGFLEVETPRLVACPGLEPHLVAFTVVGEPPRYLPTSPELHLKRLLAAGYERIYEMGRVFRRGESGRHHLPEFTLLEWYRTGSDLAALMNDCEGLLRHLSATIEPHAGPGAVCLRDQSIAAPFARLTYRGALQRYAGIDPVDFPAAAGVAPLRAEIERLGLHTAEDDDRDTLLTRVFVDRVEPQLGLARPCFVTEFPASQAALARVREEPGWPVAERFELYVAGVELANAFDELTDAVEQRRRFQAWQEQRRSLAAEVYPIDEGFMAALESGLPPCVGIALGVDRLAMLVTGAADVASVVAFPEGAP